MKSEISFVHEIIVYFRLTAIASFVD